MEKWDNSLTDRQTVKLRKLCEKDVEGMLEWMHEPTINQFYRFDAQHMTIDSAQKFINDAQAFDVTRHYAVVDDNDEYLGTVSLKGIDETNGKAEYAIAIRKKFHGTGVSSQATNEILKIAFLELGLNKVYLNVLENNLRANGFYRKYGFVFEGVFREDVNIRGKLLNLSWYSILKDEFKVRLK